MGPRKFLKFTAGLVCLLALLTACHARPSWCQRLLSDNNDVSSAAQYEAGKASPEEKQEHTQELTRFLQKSTPLNRNQLDAIGNAMKAMGDAARPATPLFISRLKSAGPDAIGRAGDALRSIGATAETAEFFIAQLENPPGTGMDPFDAAGALVQLQVPSHQAVKALLKHLPSFGDRQMWVAGDLAKLSPWTEEEAKVIDAYINSSDPATVHAASFLSRRVFPGRPVDQRRIFAAIPNTMERASCRAGENSFEVVLKSETGEWSNDDYSIWILDGARDPVPALEGEEGFFSFLPSSGPRSPCDVRAFVEEDKNILIPLLRDDRPAYKTLALLLYDPVKHEVVASQSNIAQVADVEWMQQYPPAGLDPLPNGVSIKTVKLTQPDGCGEGSIDKTPCEDFQGKKVKSSNSDYIFVSWDIIRDPGEKGWRKKLNVEKTRQANPIGNAFRDEKDFPEMFGLDAEHDQVARIFYVEMKLTNGETWYCPSEQGERPEDTSRCRPAKK